MSVTLPASTPIWVEPGAASMNQSVERTARDAGRGVDLEMRGLADGGHHRPQQARGEGQFHVAPAPLV